MSSATTRVVVVLACLAAVGAVVGTTLSAFSAVTNNSGNSFEAATSFGSSFSIATSAFDLRDAADGSESNESQILGFEDGRLRRTTAWATASAPDRYLDLDLSDPLPSGQSVSPANLKLKLASEPKSGNACFYFEVRRASTNAVLGTHGSPSSPVACSSGATQLLTTTDISSEVTSTDIANDLRIRVFGWETDGSAWDVDLATVTGSYSGKGFTLYTESDVDAADTTPATTSWRLAAQDDGFHFQTTGTWDRSFSTGRYLTLTFPAYVPSGATVTAASLKHAYRPSDGSEVCWYFEVYSGTTLLATHGSSAAPISCNSSSTTNQVDTVSLPEIDTAAKANGAIVKVYMKSAGGKYSWHDLAKLSIAHSP